MKIKTTYTEIECTAEELRQSNTLSDSFVNLFRNCFAGPISYTDPAEEEKDDRDNYQQ